jgi:hypothetical protein
MRNRHLTLVAAALAALLLVVAFARASGTRPTDAPVRGNLSLAEARAAPGLDLYYAGASIAGLPLTAVERRGDSARYVSFLYGDCPASDHQGCALPLEIQTWPACARSLSLYDDRDPFAPQPERGRVRGAPAGILDDGRQLELQTGSSTVVIFGETRGLVNRAAAALRGVNNSDPPGDPLRPPVAGAVEGRLTCP